MEPVEYWERRFLEACDIGLGWVVRAVGGGDVTRGGRAARFWLVEGEVTAVARGEGADDELADMMAVMLGSWTREAGRKEGRKEKKKAWWRRLAYQVKLMMKRAEACGQ